MTRRTRQSEALWSHFADAGDIVSVRVVRDPATQVGKGFAYVRFVEKSAMQLALDLEGSELAGRKIRVTRSAEKKKRPAAREKPKPMGAERRLATKTGKPGKKPTSFEGARAKPGDTVKLRKPKGAAGKNKPGKKKVHRGRKPGDKKGK